MSPSLNLTRELAQRLHSSVAQQLTAAAMIAHVLTERLHSAKSPDASLAKELTEKLTLASSQLRDIMIECSGAAGSL
jgi:hypothetical protein